MLSAHKTLILGGLRHLNSKLNILKFLNKFFKIIGFLSVITILLIITFNFFIYGHLEGNFEIGFNIKSKQIYIMTTLIILIIVCTIASLIIRKIEYKKEKINDYYFVKDLFLFFFREVFLNQFNV